MLRLTCVLLAMWLPILGCAALQNITPAQRAAAYEREAVGVSVLCKAYRFDRASGLTDAAPKMAKACEAVP